MQKIKNAISERRERKHTEKEGYANEGYANEGSYANEGMVGGMGTHSVTGSETVEAPVAVGVAEVPVVVTEEQRVHHHEHHAAAATEVCGQKTFTEVEDRPIVKERVERYVEHNPVEKQYVVETRYVGERPVSTTQPVTPIGVDERVVEVAEPGPKCPTSAGAMMEQSIAGDRAAMAGHHHTGVAGDRAL